MTAEPVTTRPDAVDLSWLPLGAGGRVVRRNGRLFEAVAAWRERRPPRDLFHAALEITHDGTPYVVEMAPAWGVPDGDLGVSVRGPVGSRVLGRWRAFRYEIRCWEHGVIPDARYAVDSPRRVSEDVELARAVLALVPRVPPLTWGRDERSLGEMWNSNSVVAWLLAASGHDLTGVTPPDGGRAPGWDAGLALADRIDPAPIPASEDVGPWPGAGTGDDGGHHGATVRP